MHSSAPQCLTKAAPARVVTDTMVEFMSQAAVGPRLRWSSHSPPRPGAPCFYVARSHETLDQCCHTSLPANKSTWGVESESQTWSRCLQQAAMAGRCQSATQQDALSRGSGRSHSNGCTSLREAANLADHIFALPESFQCHHRQRPDPQRSGLLS